MSETILPGFETTLVCRCGLKESEWREDETLIGKNRRKGRESSKEKRVGREHRGGKRMFLFYSASLLSALKVRRRDTQSRNV